MTVLLKVNHEKETVHLPTRVRGIYPVEKRILLQCGRALPIRWVKVNDLSPLWPASHFRNEMLAAASAWIAQMAKRGYTLHGHEGDVQVCGPYKPKRWDLAAATDPHVGSATDGGGHATDMADMLLYANFVVDHGKVNADDHERLAAHAGKDYDRALTLANNNVLEAMLALPQDALPPSEAARIAVALVDERERRADPYGHLWR